MSTIEERRDQYLLDVSKYATSIMVPADTPDTDEPMSAADKAKADALIAEHRALVKLGCLLPPFPALMDAVVDIAGEPDERIARIKFAALFEDEEGDAQ